MAHTGFYRVIQDSILGMLLGYIIPNNGESHGQDGV